VTRAPRIDRGDLLDRPEPGGRPGDALQAPFCRSHPCGDKCTRIGNDRFHLLGERLRQSAGLTVPIRGDRILGVAVCNQVRTFDLTARVQAGSARFVERIDEAATEEIVARMLSVIDPAK